MAICTYFIHILVSLVFLHGLFWLQKLTAHDPPGSPSLEAFFGANFLRLDMTRAASTRGPGIDQGKPVFSIYATGIHWVRSCHPMMARISPSL
jgi:hypothetical protein